jgi:parvulin-like peptidyl-prolyl isomerase
VSRATRTLAAAGLAALLVSGCGGTIRAGAAATVGDERITQSELEELVSRGLKDPSAQQTVGADRPGFERSVLSRLIQHEVLTVAAGKRGVTVDGATVDAAYDRFANQLGGEANLRTEAAKAGIAEADLRGVIADAALRDALADELTSDVEIPDAALRQAYQEGISEYDQVHSAHVLVPTQAQARQILGQVRAKPQSFAAFAARFSQDTSNKDKGGDLGFQGRGRLEKGFEDAIFAAKPGAFVIAKTSFGYHVIHVIERRTTSFEQAKVLLRRTLLGDQRAFVLQDELAKTARELGVHINPRFGSWDPTTEDVIASPLCADAISSPSPRAAETDAAAPEPSASPAC